MKLFFNKKGGGNMSDNRCCEFCVHKQGYSNTGYWCDINHKEIEEEDYCRCFEPEEDEEEDEEQY